MVIFISWSGEIAKSIAEALKSELLNIFEGDKEIEVFVSSQDITAGAEWFQEITNAIENSVLGILCLTKENTTNENIADWIIFEAGALAFHLKDKKAIIPMLFNTNLPAKSPLRPFEFIKFNATQYKKLICDINDKYLNKHHQDNNARDLANVSYSRLQPKINAALNKLEDSDKIEVFPPGDMYISPGSVYLSCPMASVKEEDYKAIRSLVLKIPSILKESCAATDVYVPAENIKTPDDFDEPEKAANDNFGKLKKAEVLLCIFPKPVATSMLSEIGYAIALNKKIIIFVLKRYRSKLPYFLKDGEKSIPKLKIYEYSKDDDVIRKIKGNGKTFLK